MFGANFFGQELPRGNFTSKYKSYSVSMLPGPARPDVEKGGKIIMPPSALDMLTRLNIQYPMLFKLTNQKKNRETHCGVLEFVADEGKIFIPYWMMRNLLLEEDDIVQLENVPLPVATYAKFQPQSTDFLDITNPKAVLENALRNFACLTKGDVIAIKYNEKNYELCVIEAKPGNAVSIIECDMNVDFDEPIGYVEPQRVPRVAREEEDMAVDVASIIEKNTFRAFCGSGNRLDGKQKNTGSCPAPLDASEIRRGVPNYDYKRGKLTFIRVSKSQTNAADNDEQNDFEAFSGKGQSLRKKGPRRP